MTDTILQAANELISAEAGSFDLWRELTGRRRMPHVADLVASQESLHSAAQRLRHLCTADVEAASRLQQSLLQAQVDGESLMQAASASVGSAGHHGAIRRQWIARRWLIIQQRDAVSIGLGWPHRGEFVTVTADHVHDAAAAAAVTGIHLRSYDINNATHQVGFPDLAAACSTASLSRNGRSRQRRHQARIWCQRSCRRVSDEMRLMALSERCDT
jgi:hypothetical protein